LSHSVGSPEFQALALEPRLWINGAWVDGQASLPVANPATDETIIEVACGSEAELGVAIDGAAAVLPTWSRLPAARRGEVLQQAAAMMKARRAAFATVLTLEQGKPKTQALAEVDYAASFFQWFGEEARRLCGRIQSHPTPGFEYFVQPVPAGVVGLVTPWNFPLAQGAKKVAAALAAGCTAVWKPAELTPLVALAMGPLLAEAGLPPGVLQIVVAEGRVAGEAFTRDSRVRVMSLTGSTQTGKTVAAASARHLPRLSLELGGNAPFIVLPDADLDEAAADLVKLKLLCSGQVCVTANRIFVSAWREEEFLARLRPRWLAARVGNGQREGIDAGPLINHEACRRIERLVADAIRDGAQEAGVNRSHEDGEPAERRGSFFPPTIVRGVRDEMALVTTEIFGPVAPILTYRSVDEAVRRANATPFGLAAYVYGRDLGQARAVAEALEAGIVGVNEWRPLRAEIPFGGIKESGLGWEGGEEGLREFLELKTIALPRPRLSPSS
jgi:succinate-semialdehyde dehydrogenase/glutarate-semialdehyde dehydrogenase